MNRIFQHAADAIAHAMGRPATFAACIGLVLIWALSGPFLGFSDTWQLIINTGTTVLTFLQVVLLQATQNRDTMAIQAKLDELLRAGPAHNRYVGIEDLSEDEVDQLREACKAEARGQGLQDEAGDQA